MQIEKQNVISKCNEYLLYAIIVEFQLFGTVWAMMDVAGKPYLLLYWGFVALALVKLCIQQNSWKEWLLIIAFGIVAVLSFRSSQDKTPLLLMLGVCCSKDVKLDKLLQVDLIGRLVSAVLLIALPLAGLYENKVFFARDIYRTCFGWQAPNGMGFSFTVIAMEWMYLRHRRFKWFDYAGSIAMILFLDRTANSRTAELLMVGILIAEFISTYTRKLKSKDDVYKVWTACCIIAFAMAVFAFVSAIVIYYFNQPLWNTFESTLMLRFRKPGVFLAAHGWSLFGRPYSEGIDEYLDILFAYLTLHLGIIVAGIVLILFIKAILYGHKKMDERYLLLLLFVISRSIIESEHLTLVYSWFPALLGMAMFDSQKTKTEMRV